MGARKEKRINISVSEEMLEKLDYYSGLFGIPRASLCTMLIGQGVVAWDKSMYMTESMVQQLHDRIAEEIQNRVAARAGAAGNASGVNSGKT